MMRLPKLAQTLHRIAEGGAKEFYEGSLATDILADLHDHGCARPHCFLVQPLNSVSLQGV